MMAFPADPEPRKEEEGGHVTSINNAPRMFNAALLHHIVEQLFQG